MKNNILLGSLLTLLAALFYSLQTALVKVLGNVLPPLPVVIFIQSLVSLLMLMPILFRNGLKDAKKTMSTQRIKLHLLRAVFSLAISYLLFYSISFIPLVNGLLLANTAPLIVPFLAYLFLSQKINHRLWIPILIGYAGVAIVLQPDSRIFNIAALLALGAGLALASTMLTVRKLFSTESTETTAFYFFLLSSIISGIIAIFFWTPISLRMGEMMLAIGILYFLCQYASTAALKYINPQLMGSLFYSNIIYAVILSVFIWHIYPSAPTLLGMVFIILGGILCIRVEQSANKQIKSVQLGELSYAKEIEHSKLCA